MAKKDDSIPGIVWLGLLGLAGGFAYLALGGKADTGTGTGTTSTEPEAAPEEYGTSDQVIDWGVLADKSKGAASATWDWLKGLVV